MSNPTIIPEADKDLLSDIKKFITRYVAMPNDDATLVLSIWTLHTWLFNAANVTPYLYVFSSEPGCGKTRLLEVMSCLSRNARRADDMTTPVMFKLIGRECPTLLKDEIDTIWSGSRNESQRQLYNTGYRKGGSAWRERAGELTEFSTFCPKVLSGINNGFMPTTVRDRCIPIELHKRRDDQTIERFVENRVRSSSEMEALLDRIAEFAEDFYADVSMMRPEPMIHLDDRQDEISEPLLAIGCVLGVEDELRTALTKLFATGNKTQPNPTQVIFRRIHTAFQGEPKIWSEELCAAVGPMYTPKTLALWLEPYRIAPKNVRKGNQVQRGYTIDQFEGAFQKYLGVEPEPETDSENGANHEA